jgi:hypothetical protein
MNYYETYVPVGTWFAIRLMIVFGIFFGWSLQQVDFFMAYLQVPIEMDLYMELPQGIQTHRNTFGNLVWGNRTENAARCVSS